MSQNIPHTVYEKLKEIYDEPSKQKQYQDAQIRPQPQPPHVGGGMPIRNGYVPSVYDLLPWAEQLQKEGYIEIPECNGGVLSTNTFTAEITPKGEAYVEQSESDAENQKKENARMRRSFFLNALELCLGAVGTVISIIATVISIIALCK
jgi:hypothetical protein